MSGEQLSEYTAELRYVLKCEGQTDRLIARCFALVREAAGRAIGMRHFDVQLIGGWAMARGMLAEMETGQGKTLTATLPACAAALAGIPVHVVTANDYLVERDAQLMRPVYEALGLRVGAVRDGMDAEARRAAYACDITYCTGQQLVFDYLKDRLARGNSTSRLNLTLEKLDRGASGASRLLLRGLCYAIVDEADSVLIDEARTPLVLSRRSEARPQQEDVVPQALALAAELTAGVDFTVRKQRQELLITEPGKARLASLGGALGGLWDGPRRREALVEQALRALYLFERDKHYLVREGAVQIIDQNTGRIMPDRSWEHGLHQMIEIKEGCELTGQNQTLARISYQRFFRRYLKLSGMSGTLREVAGELWSTYGLDAVRVPPNRPSRRSFKPERVYMTASQKWKALVEAIREVHARGRPVLVGTCSVATSEHVGSLLTQAGLAHRVLNARQDRQEAEIIAQAGEAGRITVATNMAGRGTDIVLAPGVAERGGLHVIATERNEARRIDRQLFGRCARQGDPGSCEAILSLEDERTAGIFSRPIRCLLSKLIPSDCAVAGWLGSVLTAAPQRATERRHARLRRDLLELDEHLGNLLAFAGETE